MATETRTEPTEVYPWDLPRESSVDHAAPDRLTASFFLRTNTPLALFDYPDAKTKTRVTGIHIGDLSMHVGLDGDGEIVETVDLLIGLLAVLRNAALARQAETIR